MSGPDSESCRQTVSEERAREILAEVSKLRLYVVHREESGRVARSEPLAYWDAVWFAAGMRTMDGAELELHTRPISADLFRVPGGAIRVLHVSRTANSRVYREVPTRN